MEHDSMATFTFAFQDLSFMLESTQEESVSREFIPEKSAGYLRT
jgi:hypothetical protein